MSIVPKLIDLTGERFGKLMVLRRMNNNKRRQSYWLCQCDCGIKKKIRGDHLKNGHTKSCGCLKIKHGHSTRIKITPTYRSWHGMHQRCTNPNHKYYKYYGGRGITVYERWRKFENFLKDMGECPKGHQIDRINNDKGYCKSNCRWATRKEQQRNTRSNRLVTYNKKTQCIAMWAEETGIHQYVIRWRINNNWSPEKTLTIPVKKRKERNDNNSRS